ncbi:MAG TPA: hypothetical protein VK870_04890 [Ignavibacteriaceae bacterium]|nr:hypothetical protein [Ignavibacteriaceae bacterium]
MKKSVLFWLLALAITLAAAYYQRLTGPTYPIENKFIFNGKYFNYKFDRSHGGDSDHPVSLDVQEHLRNGTLKWKRFKTNDEWNFIQMRKEDGKLIAYLPNQPPAGKLEYQVILSAGETKKVIPANPVVIRFKGDVPPLVLIPHIIFIFAAMLLSNRTALECFVEKPNLKKYTVWTFILLLLGGMILGPIVQKYAFGEYWTGFPFGTDLTDNKTLIAFVGWIVALIAVFKSEKPKWYILLAAVIMFIIFIIPHSLFGSELDYSTLNE